MIDALVNIIIMGGSIRCVFDEHRSVLSGRFGWTQPSCCMEGWMEAWQMYPGVLIYMYVYWRGWGTRSGRPSLLLHEDFAEL